MRNGKIAMKLGKLLKLSLAATCLLGFGEASARALVGLDYSVMTGNTLQIVFTFDEAASEPRTFTIDQPARIALDFGQTENRLAQRNVAIGVGAVLLHLLPKFNQLLFSKT